MRERSRCSCTSRSTAGRRSFPVAASIFWNTLPDDVQSAPSVSSFRRQLKRSLFLQSFPDILVLISVLRSRGLCNSLGCFNSHSKNSRLTLTLTLAYDVHQHENVVFDGRSTVIGDHRLVDDDQCLDEPLATDRPRSPPPARPGSPSRCPAASRRPPFVVIVGRRGPDHGHWPVISGGGVARVRRWPVPVTVIVCTHKQHRSTCRGD